MNKLRNFLQDLSGAPGIELYWFGVRVQGRGSGVVVGVGVVGVFDFEQGLPIDGSFDMRLLPFGEQLISVYPLYHNSAVLLILLTHFLFEANGVHFTIPLIWFTTTTHSRIFFFHVPKISIKVHSVARKTARNGVMGFSQYLLALFTLFVAGLLVLLDLRRISGVDLLCFRGKFFVLLYGNIIDLEWRRRLFKVREGIFEKNPIQPLSRVPLRDEYSKSIDILMIVALPQCLLPPHPLLLLLLKGLQERIFLSFAYVERGTLRQGRQVFQ